MIPLPLRASRIVLIHGKGKEDVIHFWLSERTTHPLTGYQAYAEIRTAEGFGHQWLKEVYDMEPDDVKCLDLSMGKTNLTDSCEMCHESYERGFRQGQQHDTTY